MSRCQSYKSLKELTKQCPHPVTKGIYCGFHQSCDPTKIRFDKSSEQSRQQPCSSDQYSITQSQYDICIFDIVDQHVIQTICSHMIEQQRYYDVSLLIRTCKRIKQACQQLLDDEKEYLCNQPPTLIDDDGNKKWCNQKNQLHRGFNLPAIEFVDGSRAWYVNGQRHREGDLPAIEYYQGSYEWYKYGQLHRDGGLPAIEHSDGCRQWYINGQHYRDGGLPAIEYANGHREWFVNGQHHRDGDLPAVEYADGGRAWFVNGNRHRDGGLPAFENTTGRRWYINGLLHRDGGLPAIEHAGGDREWYINGLLHRDGGLPAVTHLNGHNEWWVNGKKIHKPRNNQYIN